MDVLICTEAHEKNLPLLQRKGGHAWLFLYHSVFCISVLDMPSLRTDGFCGVSVLGMIGRCSPTEMAEADWERGAWSTDWFQTYSRHLSASSTNCQHATIISFISLLMHPTTGKMCWTVSTFSILPPSPFLLLISDWRYFDCMHF